jgi:hypothetical protein
MAADLTPDFQRYSTQVHSSLKAWPEYANSFAQKFELIVYQGTPVIYVNFNYRLGPLGFPQGREARNQGALNLGLKDQLAALKWVQLHIETFGGDKDKVRRLIYIYQN